MHGNYRWPWTFHNLLLLVSSFSEDVVKRWRKTSQTLLAFGQSLRKLWCSGWEPKPTPFHPSLEPAAGKNRPTQRPVWTHTLVRGHWGPREQLHLAPSSWWGDSGNRVLHPTLSIAQARQTERRTQLQPALWTSLPPRGLHQDLHIIPGPVFLWLVLYLLPATVFLGSRIKSHSAPANSHCCRSASTWGHMRTFLCPITLLVPLMSFIMQMRQRANGQRPGVTKAQHPESLTSPLALN